VTCRLNDVILKGAWFTPATHLNFCLERLPKGQLMTRELLHAIRVANRDFQDFIEQFSKDGSKLVETRGAVRRLGKVDLRLKQVAQYLATATGTYAREPEAAYQVMKYRENLKALRTVIETLQFSLLAERARLEQIRANMQAASAWAASLREIS
jgi:hypothetical protein